jgi:alpha-L-fucosidase
LEAVLNLKKTKVSGAYQEGICVQALERSKLEGIKPEPWQICTSINGPRFCGRGANYMTPSDVIDMLADIVGKNGNLLLALPLMADRALDDELERLLAEMGRWMVINGEAIFGTRPWLIFGEGPTKVKNEYSETIQETFTVRDFRFKTKGKILYLIGLAWPDGGGPVTIASLTAGRNPVKISSLSLLGHNWDLRWEQGAQGLKVHLPERRLCDHAFVIKIAS